MNIALHLFTNCCKQYPLDKLLQTYESFCNTFGKITPTIWIDPHPNKPIYNRYIIDLKNAGFVNLYKSDSLSDAYIKAIRSSTTDYCFMLEHDWIILKDRINHSLEEITAMMNKNKIYHFRFNKKTTVLHGRFDRYLKEKESNGIKYCITPFLSNNPHILNRKVYIEFVKAGMIEKRSKSHGIEELISQYKETYGCIYGPKGYEKTIHHLDGRGKYGKSKKKRPDTLFKRPRIRV